MPAGCLPDLSAGKLRASPRREVQFDTFTSVLQGDRSSNEYNCDNNRKAHGEVDHPARQTDTTEDAQPAQKPGEEGPSDRLTQQSSAWILCVVGDSTAIGSKIPYNRVDVGDYIAIEELFASVGPRKRAGE